MRFILLVLAILAAATPAGAGAWLREKGTGFASSSFTLNQARDTSNTTFLEYGLREKLTLGLDVSYYGTALGNQTGVATLFMRRPLGSTKRKSVWSYELGIGASWDGELVEPHLKTGLSWGRGFQWREMNGWMNVDTSVRWSMGLADHIGKIDGTVGLTFTDVTTGMMQIYVSHIGGDTFGTIAPSVIFQPRGRKFRIQIGAESPLDDTRATAIKVGIWRTF